MVKGFLGHQSCLPLVEEVIGARHPVARLQQLGAAARACAHHLVLTRVGPLTTHSTTPTLVPTAH